MATESESLTTKDTKLHEGVHAGIPFVFLRVLCGLRF
jgi:hypothetical protein